MKVATRATRDTKEKEEVSDIDEEGRIENEPIDLMGDDDLEE